MRVVRCWRLEPENGEDGHCSDSQTRQPMALDSELCGGQHTPEGGIGDDVRFGERCQSNPSDLHGTRTRRWLAARSIASCSGLAGLLARYAVHRELQRPCWPSRAFARFIASCSGPAGLLARYHPALRHFLRSRHSTDLRVPDPNERRAPRCILQMFGPSLGTEALGAAADHRRSVPVS